VIREECRFFGFAQDDGTSYRLSFAYAKHDVMPERIERVRAVKCVGILRSAQNDGLRNVDRA